MAQDSDTPVRLWLGPPPPRAISVLTRVLELVTFLVMSWWVFGYLGGIAFHPHRLTGKVLTNDTGVIFNWHPLLMTLAFPVFMAEAVLAYRVPLSPSLDRKQRKLVHAGLHTAALICIVAGVIAAIQSHNLKRPARIPNFYSPHSYLGLFTIALAVLQFLLGFGAFLYPGFSRPHREALAPLHAYLGKAAFVSGLATMAVGLQEKAAFVATARKLAGPGLYSAYISIPAALQLLLAATGILVLYHHVPTPASRRRTAEHDDLLADVIDDPAVA